MSLVEILFYILSGLTLLSASLMIFTKNPVHSILYLIITFFCISGHYILLNAQFLAVVNIIVYAGAIMVLFLFVVMLMNLNEQTYSLGKPIKVLVAVVVAGLFFVTTVGILFHSGLNDSFQADMGKGDVGLVKVLGNKLYSDYVLPFELSSVLFIAAMIGAVVLSKKEGKLLKS